MFPSKNPNFPYDKYTRFDLYITHEWSWVQSRIQVWQKGPSSSCWSLADSTINAQNLLRQFGLHWGTCGFGHFELRRKQKVSWVGRDIVEWFVRNVIMQSLQYKWQNWQYIKKTNKINSRFHRDGKSTDLTSPTWGRRPGRMRSQSRPNLTRSPRRRRPENVCILSSLLFRHDVKMAADISQDLFVLHKLSILHISQQTTWIIWHCRLQRPREYTKCRGTGTAKRMSIVNKSLPPFEDNAPRNVLFYPPARPIAKNCTVTLFVSPNFFPIT